MVLLVRDGSGGEKREERGGYPLRTPYRKFLATPLMFTKTAWRLPSNPRVAMLSWLVKPCSGPWITKRSGVTAGYWCVLDQWFLTFFTAGIP